MKKIFTLMAIVAMSAAIMVGCSGNGSSKGSPFGSLPEKCEQFKQESAKLGEQMEHVKSEAEKAELMKKHEKLVASSKPKIEESAKALNGKAITVESDLDITEPLSFQFYRFFEEDKLNPDFKVNGSAKTTADITGIRIGAYIKSISKDVHLVGYNAEGKEVYDIRIGSIASENRDGYAFFPAGTPVKFDSFTFDLSAQQCKDAQTLKLEVR